MFHTPPFGVCSTRKVGLLRKYTPPTHRSPETREAGLTSGRLFIETPESTSTPPEGDSNVGGVRVFEFWEADVKPVDLNSHSVRPNYPDSAKEAGLTGSVFLKFKINVNGSVSDVQVLKGNAIFSEPAIDAVSRYRYIPAKHHGKPVPVWNTLRIAFAPPEPQDEASSEKSDRSADGIHPALRPLRATDDV